MTAKLTRIWNIFLRHLLIQNKNIPFTLKYSLLSCLGFPVYYGVCHRFRLMNWDDYLILLIDNFDNF